MSHLYGLDWIALLALIVAFYYQWSSKNDGRFYAFYKQAERRYAGFPDSSIFGIVWAILYGALVSAVFVFYIKYDGCIVHNALYGASDVCWDSLTSHEYTWVWVLILINWVLLKMWDVVVQHASRTRFALALLVSLASLATAVVISILFFHAHHYYPAVVYLVLSAWLLYASYLAWVLYANYRKLKGCVPACVPLDNQEKCGC